MRCGIRLVATIPILPMAWEPPYATGAALQKTEKKKKSLIKKRKKERKKASEHEVKLRGGRLWRTQ